MTKRAAGKQPTKRAAKAKPKPKPAAKAKAAGTVKAKSAATVKAKAAAKVKAKAAAKVKAAATVKAKVAPKAKSAAKAKPVAAAKVAPKATPPAKATPAAKAITTPAPAPWLALDDAARARVAAVLDGRASVDTLRTPTERHYLALRWNWDAGVAPLRQVVDHPECALATAQHVLWHSLPDELIGFYATRADAERGDGEGEVFDLQLAICARAAAGGFAHHGVGYDPTDADGADFTEDWDADAAKHPIPTVLFVAVDGPRADPAIRF